MRATVERIRAADDLDFAQLSPEAAAALGEMVVEREELETAIGEARTPAHRDILRQRFARSYGGVAATVGRTLEKARPYARNPGAWIDGVIKNYRRWETLEDIWQWLVSFGQGGPQTP